MKKWYDEEYEFEIEVVGFLRGDHTEHYCRNGEEIGEMFEQACERALTRIGLQGESFAKGKCPVDTGNLRNSISNKVEMSEKSAYIGTNVEYAP